MQTPADFENWKREEYRKSMDTWLVYNPTDKDYFVIWDRIPHLIPNKDKDVGFGRGQAELSKFLAEKYMNEMKDILINLENERKLKEKLEDRSKKGMQELTPYEKNVQLVEFLPRTSDETQILEKYGILFKGVVREFGLYENMPMEGSSKPDIRTPEEKALESLMNKKAVRETSPEPLKQTNKAEAVKSITQE